ncbi:MAG: hypothetical protein AAGA70_06600 [Pseudomonadota bacterium]
MTAVLTICVEPGPLIANAPTNRPASLISVAIVVAADLGQLWFVDDRVHPLPSLLIALVTSSAVDQGHFVESQAAILGKMAFSSKGTQRSVMSWTMRMPGLAATQLAVTRAWSQNARPL